MTTTFVIDDTTLSGIARVRKYAEDARNWRCIMNGRLELTDFSHLIHSGDVNAAFSWVMTGSDLIRHLSVRQRGQAWSKTQKHSPVSPEVAFTIAHLLGYTGAKPSGRSGMVNDCGKNWMVGTNPSDGALIVQQHIKRIACA